MILNKNGRKMRHPYATMAVLGLAATGVVSIVNKGKKFVKNQKNKIVSTMNGMKYE